MNLSEEQQKIVNLNSGQHLVLAPPGTGKTELLVQRLSHAVKNGTDEKKMVCLTFTNRAAKNMLDRIEKEIGKHNIFIGNIHSFCNTFLRKQRVIAQNISLLDEEDVETLFKQISSPKEASREDRRGYDEFYSEEDCELSEYQESITLKSWVVDKYKQGENNTRPITSSELLMLNSYLKSVSLNIDFSLVGSPEIEYKSDADENNAFQICEEYEKIKQESNFMDFDDLLILTYNYLINIDKEKCKQIGYTWIQIDEVQDLNPLQWAIVDLISNKTESHRAFFGDYEQSIFSFMGAKLEVLNAIAADSIVHELHYNYRSPQYLLDLYNTYARALLDPKWKHNPISMNTFEKPANGLRFKEISGDYVMKGSKKNYGHSIDAIKTYSTESDEIKWIINNILPKEPQENTAILVRSNATADAFANLFNENEVQYFKISGFDLFQRKIIKDLMAFLNIFVNPYDRNAWIRNLNLYGKIKSLKDARIMANDIFEVGILPLDFISGNHINLSYLDDLLKNFENQRIVVFDTETTGLDTDNDDVIQIAAVELINGKVGQIFEVYINTAFDLTESEKIHKISKEYLDEYAIDKTDAFTQFLDFVGDDILVAHNSEYDYKIIASNLKRIGIEKSLNRKKIYDSIDVAKRVHPRLPSYKLEFLLNHLNIKGVNSHNAVDDVKATANLLKSLCTNILETQIRRSENLNKYEKVIHQFSKNFSPIYVAVEGHFGRELAMENLVDMIIHYMQDQMKYKMQPNIYDEIEKLTRHMKFKCLLNETLKSIKKYIPDYSKYKESDLVVGNEKIVIATIHKAKGLEFENVIIPGCTDGNFPSYFSKQDGEQAIIEDARLLYVAMTRARKRLLITSHTIKIIKTRRGPWEQVQEPSRFLTPIMHMLESKS
jgi:DNA helicase-2/ATP-dependent DNA helicase PcrA